jgi:hypothetical protein
MWNQKTLFNKVLDLPKSKAELDAVCCESCYTATEPECDCRCHGAYHGLGNLNSSKQVATVALPECRSFDKAERTLNSLKNVGEVLLEP